MYHMLQHFIARLTSRSFTLARRCVHKKIIYYVMRVINININMLRGVHSHVDHIEIDYVDERSRRTVASVEFNEIARIPEKPRTACTHCVHCRVAYFVFFSPAYPSVCCLSPRAYASFHSRMGGHFDFFSPFSSSAFPSSSSFWHFGI